MRYRVVTVQPGDRPVQSFVTADNFHTTGERSVTFTAFRNRNNGQNDQWGQPVAAPRQIFVAFFANVISIVEDPEVDPFQGEVGFADNWQPGGLGMVGRNVGAVAVPDIPAPRPIRMDDDGVAWDAERDE